MTVSAAFLDSNVLVYANDISDPRKQALARELVRNHVRRGTGIISTQVLAEFWVTVTQKLPRPLDRSLAQQQLALFSAFTVVPVDHGVVLSAVRLQNTHHISYWDAQILAAAEAADCATLYSEDMQDGVLYGSVTVRNPFKP